MPKTFFQQDLLLRQRAVSEVLNDLPLVYSVTKGFGDTLRWNMVASFSLLRKHEVMKLKEELQKTKDDYADSLQMYSEEVHLLERHVQKFVEIDINIINTPSAICAKSSST